MIRDGSPRNPLVALAVAVSWLRVGQDTTLGQEQGGGRGRGATPPAAAFGSPAGRLPPAHDHRQGDAVLANGDTLVAPVVAGESSIEPRQQRGIGDVGVKLVVGEG